MKIYLYILFVFVSATNFSLGGGVNREYLKDLLTDLAENDKKSEFFSKISAENLINHLAEQGSRDMLRATGRDSAYQFSLNVDTLLVVSREQMKHTKLRELIASFISDQVERDKSTTLVGRGSIGSAANAERSLYSFHYKYGDRRYGVITITTVEAGGFAVATLNKVEKQIYTDFFRDLIATASPAEQAQEAGESCKEKECED